MDLELTNLKLFSYIWDENVLHSCTLYLLWWKCWIVPDMHYWYAKIIPVLRSRSLLTKWCSFCNTFFLLFKDFDDLIKKILWIWDKQPYCNVILRIGYQSCFYDLQFYPNSISELASVKMNLIILYHNLSCLIIKLLHRASKKNSFNSIDLCNK